MMRREIISLLDSVVFMRRIAMGAALVLFTSLPSPVAADEMPSMGFIELPQADGRMTTVFYPSSGTERPVRRGPFSLSWAPDGQPVTGNRHLILISHGSGGSPWVHVDLARTLVHRGFTVAIPLHQGNHYLDPSEPGPPSWRKRPREISDAINALPAMPCWQSIYRLIRWAYSAVQQGATLRCRSPAGNGRTNCLKPIAKATSSKTFPRVSDSRLCLREIGSTD